MTTWESIDNQGANIGLPWWVVTTTQMVIHLEGLDLSHKLGIVIVNNA